MAHDRHEGVDVDAQMKTPISTDARWWRIGRVALVVVVVLSALFYIGGGWYFSGQINSSALRVKPGTITMDLRVVGTATGTITLHEQHGRERGLRVDQVYGLSWASGYGQLSGAPTSTGRDVTRTFTLLTGALPVAGTVAGLSRDAFPDDPAVAIGRPVEQVSYASPLGQLPAWFVPGTSHTWAVLVHGWTASRTEMLRMMRDTVQAGLPSLDITYRNDAGAPPDPSHKYQYGRTEWRDLDAAVGYALAHGAASVELLGASMGGGIIASFMQHSAHAGAVTAIVFDAPMLSFGRAVDLAASRKHLPVIGLPVPGSLTWVAKQLAGMRYDINWSAVDYLHNTGWDTPPTLVFHGDADTRVPISGSRALAHARPANVNLVVVHDAGHVEAWNVDPGAYDRAVTRFVQTHS